MSKKLIQAAAGAAGGESVYVEDVFSTYLYQGTGSTQSIDNGLDLDGEGGLVWIKNRDQTDFHILVDTERGTGNRLSSNSTGGQSTDADTVTAFNSNGFTIGADVKVNTNTESYVSWTFEKAAGFFDCVSWTGDGTSGRSISHNLGSTPGFIIIKRTNSSSNWLCYHRSLGIGQRIVLQSTAAAASDTNISAVSDSSFTVGNGVLVNNSGDTYVAYVFAHDDQSFGDGSDESIIKCGSYTGNGSNDGPSITLGWEPQWILVKRAVGGTGNWVLLDVMRGLIVGDGDRWLQANKTDVEYPANIIAPTATGFELDIDTNDFNASGSTYIYIAIRRPMRTPEAGTDVFSVYGYQDTGLTSGSGTASNRTIINGGVNGGSGFPVDLFIHQWRDKAGVYAAHVFDRLRGKGKGLLTNSNSAEPAGDSASNGGFDFQEGVDVEYNGFAYYYTTAAGNRNHITYHLKRATGFCDVVAYAGDGTTNQAISHNLGVVPEFIITKRRNSAYNWFCYTSVSGAGKYILLNSTGYETTNPDIWDETSPTSTQFTVGNYMSNRSGDTYIAYLFATLDGVSKVGSYTGTGSSQDIDCGFSAGARFVLIKNISDYTDWLFYDSTRGIVSGNDPYLAINDPAVEVTTTDYIDPLNAGFTVNGSNILVNASSDTYLFFAIA